MTNGEKYLKDGVDIKQMALEMVDYFNFPPYEGIGESNIEEFFGKEVKPTLTKDERVILRNIQKGLFREGFISRTAGNELFVFIKETGETIELYIFNHLFQFIKERRRISNRRIIRR